MSPVKSNGMNEAVIVFNLLPATYADASWIDVPTLWRDRLQRLESQAARMALSDWLLAQQGMANCYDFDFAPFEKALFLQSPPELKKLAAMVGLLRHRESLRRMIAGGTLARLAEELGAESFEWGLMKLPTQDFLPPPEASLDRSAERLLPQLVADGAPCLLGLLRPAWRAVAVRARLKFSRAIAGRPPVTFDDGARQASLVYLKTHMLKEGTLWPSST
jgi:hypothetical protein